MTDVCDDMVSEAARRQPPKSALTADYSRTRPDASPEGKGWSVLTPLDVVVIRSGRAAVVQVSGELDLNTAPSLEEQLVGLVDEGVLEVTVDLADLDFIDSSGLRALVAGLQGLREQGGDVVLRSPKPRTLRVLEIMGLKSLFRLETVEDAGSVDAISGPGAHAATGS